MTRRTEAPETIRHYLTDACGGSHKAIRPGGKICRWCGIEGWLRDCPRCGFPTCELCTRVHDSQRLAREWLKVKP